MSNFGRKMTPKGQMSSSGSGPAIMMMPNHIKITFMPDPPLKHLPPPKRKRPKLHPDDFENNTNQKITTDANNDDDKHLVQQETKNSNKLNKRLIGGISGVANYMSHFERTDPPQRKINPTPASIKAIRAKKQAMKQKELLGPLIEEYKQEQKECGGEYQGMNCYNTLFVGRLQYEVTERKLLREFEQFGPVKDLKLVTVSKDSNDNNDDDDGASKSKIGKSRGYAFIEFENEEDMKKAYRAADGMRIEGREIVVDVERGHTVPNWLPRRLGGGLGGTRIGGKDKNITFPGRFDPSKPQLPPPPQGPGNMMMMGMENPRRGDGFMDHGGYDNGGRVGFHPGDRGMDQRFHGGPGRGGGGGGYFHGDHGGGGGRFPPPDGRGGRGGGPPPYYNQPPMMGGGGRGGGPGPYGYGGPPPPGPGYNRGGPPPLNNGPPPGRYGGGDRDRDRDWDRDRRDYKRPRY